MESVHYVHIKGIIGLFLDQVCQLDYILRLLDFLRLPKVTKTIK